MQRFHELTKKYKWPLGVSLGWLVSRFLILPDGLNSWMINRFDLFSLILFVFFAIQLFIPFIILRLLVREVSVIFAFSAIIFGSIYPILEKEYHQSDITLRKFIADESNSFIFRIKGDLNSFQVYSPGFRRSMRFRIDLAKNNLNQLLEENKISCDENLKSFDLWDFQMPRWSWWKPRELVKPLQCHLPTTDDFVSRDAIIGENVKGSYSLYLSYYLQD